MYDFNPVTLIKSLSPEFHEADRTNAPAAMLEQIREIATQSEIWECEVNGAKYNGIVFYAAETLKPANINEIFDKAITTYVPSLKAVYNSDYICFVLPPTEIIKLSDAVGV